MNEPRLVKMFSQAVHWKNCIGLWESVCLTSATLDGKVAEQAGQVFASQLGADPSDVAAEVDKSSP